MPNIPQNVLDALVRSGVVTLDPDKEETCCGLQRDADGFCTYRPGHPIYVGTNEKPAPGTYWPTHVNPLPKGMG